MTIDWDTIKYILALVVFVALCVLVTVLVVGGTFRRAPSTPPAPDHKTDRRTSFRHGA